MRSQSLGGRSDHRTGDFSIEISDLNKFNIIRIQIWERRPYIEFIKVWGLKYKYAYNLNTI